jgi:hypothetical protein
MKLSKFEDLLDRLGPSVGGWPNSVIEPALDLLQASVQAQDAFIRATAYEFDRFSERHMDFSSI